MATYVRIDSDTRARNLAARLNGAERTRPVVVVTTPAGNSKPWIDVEEITEKVGDLAEVYLMPTGPHSWELSHNLPPMTQVYGGAGRVYPLGHEWASEPHKSPLRFAYDAVEGRRATDLLIDDALRMATAVGLLDRAPAGKRVRRTGTVLRIMAERGIVKLDRDMGVVPDSLAVAGVPLENTLQPGMQVTGLYDPTSHWFDIRESRLDPTEALAGYQVGDLVLAKVEEVTADRATVFLHPLVAVELNQAQVTSNELDDLRSLMSPGEVLGAHVRRTGPDWELSLLEVEDDEVPVPAARLFEGGPPWLDPPPEPTDLYTLLDSEPAPLVLIPPPAVPEADVEQAPEVVEPEPASGSGAPSPLLFDRSRPRPAPRAASQPAPPAPAASPTVQQMSLTIDALRAQVSQLQAARDDAVAQMASRDIDVQLTVASLRDSESARQRAEKELASAKSRLRRAQNRARPDGPRPQFADRERGFRILVELAWATRIPVGEQPDCPIPEYDLGLRFLDSVDALDGITQEKIADVVMEVLTGKAVQSAGREVHRLRESAAGNAPYVVRGDGAIAWRANLQTHTSGARRLHYWELPGGRIELAKVGLHDDFSM